MRIFWWQGGVHLQPESDEDCEFLVEGMKVLERVRIGDGIEGSPIGGVQAGDQVCHWCP